MLRDCDSESRDLLECRGEFICTESQCTYVHTGTFDCEAFFQLHDGTNVKRHCRFGRSQDLVSKHHPPPCTELNENHHVYLVSRPRTTHSDLLLLLFSQQ